MKSYINSIGVANPSTCILQNKAIEFMSDVQDLEPSDIRKIKALYNASGIEKRYTVLKDYAASQGNFSFFPNDKSKVPFPSVEQRMKLYEQFAAPLAIQAIVNCLQDSDPKKITHLITVSCTGMSAPGIDIEIVQQLKLSHQVNRIAVNFMGCYAAFNALKMADAICKSSREATVLVVCVELCSLHFQQKITTDNLVANAIFADGAAAVIVQGEQGRRSSISLESFYCDLVIEGEKEMAWRISDYGFEMTLSSYVPKIIEGGMEKFMSNLLRKVKIDRDDLSLYAIHPGGKRILEAVEQSIGITKEDNKYAYHVLKNYGNMSSATILFVLHEILQDEENISDKANILSFAFGPGLTLESMILKYNSPLEGKLKNQKITTTEEIFL